MKKMASIFTMFTLILCTFFWLEFNQPSSQAHPSKQQSGSNHSDVDNGLGHSKDEQYKSKPEPIPPAGKSDPKPIPPARIPSPVPKPLPDHSSKEKP